MIVDCVSQELFLWSKTWYTWRSLLTWLIILLMHQTRHHLWIHKCIIASYLVAVVSCRVGIEKNSKHWRELCRSEFISRESVWMRACGFKLSFLCCQITWMCLCLCSCLCTDEFKIKKSACTCERRACVIYFVFLCLDFRMFDINLQFYLTFFNQNFLCQWKSSAEESWFLQCVVQQNKLCRSKIHCLFYA